MLIIGQMRALPKPPRSEGIAQLAVLKGLFFFHFLPKHLVLPLSEKASGVNGPWGWSNLAISTFRRDTASVLRCQGKGCVAVSRSSMLHTLGRVSCIQKARPGWVPHMTNKTADDVWCELHGNPSSLGKAYSCIPYITAIPSFWGFRLCPSTSPSSAGDRKDASSAFIAHCAKILKCLVC